MKKIINGRVYDTETAQRIGFTDAWNEYRIDVNSLRYYEEELYRKKTGEFFLYGEGNGLSRYSRPCQGGTHGPGEKIIPLSEEEAKEWVENVMSPEDYEELFSVDELDEEKEGTKVVSYRLPASVEVLAKEVAKKANMSLGDFVANAIKKYAEEFN